MRVSVFIYIYLFIHLMYVCFFFTLAIQTQQISIRQWCNIFLLFLFYFFSLLLKLFEFHVLHFMYATWAHSTLETWSSKVTRAHIHKNNKTYTICPYLSAFLVSASPASIQSYCLLLLLRNAKIKLHTVSNSLS